MDLDLGDQVVINVKIGDKSYPLRSPSYKDVKAMKGKEDQDEAVFEMIVSLGMPEDVLDNLEVAKISMLTQGLLETVTGKK